MKNYEYYLFDADGTLLDTTELIYLSFSYACKRFANYELTREQIKKNSGIPMRAQIELYLGPLSDEDYKKVYDAQAAYQLSRYQRYLKLFPNVAETLHVLKSHGKRLAIVSARRQETLLLYLKETGIYDIFDTIVSPELTNGADKPDPAPALKALAMMNGTAEQSLFVGDVDSDIECGHRAGMDTAFVAWSHNPPDSLTTQPTFFLEDIRALLS